MTTKTRTLSFGIEGESMTDIIRTCWIEGRILPALNIIRDCGCPEQFWLKVFTGELKMAGNSADDTLHLEEDDRTTHQDTPISFEEMDKRMVKEFIKQSVIYANADARMKYWSLRMDSIGVSYKTEKRFSNYEELGATFAIDKIAAEKSGSALAELKPFFTYVYPLMGKSLFDIPYHKVQMELEEFDYFHPNYLPVMTDRVKNGKKVQTTNLEDELTSRAFGKVKDKPGHVSTAITLQEELVERKKVIEPSGIEHPDIQNAWIDRKGNFYGSLRFSIGFELVHLNMADDFLEAGILPKELNAECKDNPSAYMEQTGWIKLSSNQFLFYPRNANLKVSPAQIRTIAKYARIRNMQSVNIGYFDKNVSIENLSQESFER